MVVHHHARRRVETVDQQAAFVVGRIVDRAHDSSPAAVGKPLDGRVEQRVGDVGVVDRLEHAKAADIVAVLGVVQRIVARKNPADRLIAAPRQELPRGAVSIEGMLARIEELLPFQQQRRNPARVGRVNPPREFQKAATIEPRDNRPHFDRATIPQGALDGLCAHVHAPHTSGRRSCRLSLDLYPHDMPLADLGQRFCAIL